MTECAPEASIVVTFAWGVDSTLVLNADCDDSGLWWNTLVLPDWTMRTTTAPPSAWVPGVVALAAVRDAGSLALTVAAKGTDTATLEAQKALLEGAVGQWPYTVSITVDGTVLGPWEALPAVPTWGALTPQSAGLYAAEAPLVLTVNPPGSP